MLFANNILLTVHFVFILYYGNDVGQNTNLSDFLFQVQNDHKPLKVTCHIRPEQLRNIQCSIGSGSLTKQIRALTMGDLRQAIRCWQWSAESYPQRWPSTPTWEAAGKLQMDHSILIWHFNQNEKVKQANKNNFKLFMLHELTKTSNQKKNTSFWTVTLIFYAIKMNNFFCITNF